MSFGLAFAAVIPPFVLALCHIDETPHAANAGAFAGGFTGNTLATATLTALETWFPDSVRGFVRRWLGDSGNGSGTKPPAT